MTILAELERRVDGLPKGWSRTTFGEVTTVKARIGWRGLSANEYTEVGPLLIAGKHIKSGVIDWGSCDHLSPFRYDESREIQLQSGDVILSKDGSIGNPALIEDLPGQATINGTMMMVRPHQDCLVPSYLYQVICGDGFRRMIREKISGSSIPHIFQRDIIHFPVLLPPLDEQQRIEASRVFRRLLSVRRSYDEQDKEQVFACEDFNGFQKGHAMFGSVSLGLFFIPFVIPLHRALLICAFMPVIKGLFSHRISVARRCRKDRRASARPASFDRAAQAHHSHR